MQLRYKAHRASLPPRGAWIEISVSVSTNTVKGSLPPRGAWIEIEIQPEERVGRVVAPPTGSVD